MQIDDNDALLVRRVQKGDIRAYEILVVRHEEKLLRFARRYVGNTGDAEEVVQDAFVKLYTYIDRIDITKSVLSYMFAVVHNSAISALRKTKPTVALDETIDFMIEDEIVKNLEYKDLKKNIHEAISELPKRYADVIRLHYFDDVSYEHISKKLRIPINTVRTHLRRAKKMLMHMIRI